jgi:hypothetical protein
MATLCALAVAAALPAGAQQVTLPLSQPPCGRPGWTT